MDIVPYLKLMVDREASDMFFSVGAQPNIKIQGITHPVNTQRLGPGDVKQLAYGVMTAKQTAQFESTLEMNLAISAEGIGRFRINVYQQRGEVAMVVRYIRSRIPSFSELTLPPILEKLIMLKRGLILVVGSTGSGKSTTMAAMLDHRNRSMTGHILCIEDPIEFMHQHAKSVVDQREVGIDTRTYADALKNAMREAPDVIAIGEIRDRDTMQHAIAYAETGHLCLSTLHANNSNQAIERIINFFPEDAQKQLLMDLSANLQAVVSQRLIPGTAQQLVPAVEVLLLSPLVSDMIREGRLDEIKGLMTRSTEIGMMTFDQALFALYQAGKISFEEALKNADSRTDLQLRIRLTQNVSGQLEGLSIAPDPKPPASSH